MLDNIDVSYIKTKYATLLSKMYTNAKLDINEIYNRFLFCDFLDCFENNNIRFYLSSSYEAIIYLLFKKEMVFEEELNSVLYWCGIQYMNIFLNRRVPLKQVLIIIPLEKMMTLFDTYHEMHESRLLEFFDCEYKKNSILKFLRNKRGMSTRQVSFLTGINETTIKYYEQNNNNLFNASYDNVRKIAECLQISDTLFNKKTNFCIYSSFLFENKELYNHVCTYIKEYYKEKSEIIVDSGVWYFNKKRKIFIDDIVIKNAINYALDKYKDVKLLF